jgi:hypothetical protein
MRADAELMCRIGAPAGPRLRRLPFVAVMKPPTSGHCDNRSVDVAETNRGSGGSFWSPDASGSDDGTGCTS